MRNLYYRCSVYSLNLLLLKVSLVHAQNLVPNGSFEQYSSCPTSNSPIDSCLYWNQVTTGNPDYYNQCSSSPFSGIPPQVGYQFPRTGSAMGGLITSYPSSSLTNYREYIETSLTSTLQFDMCYHFLMHINLANTRKLTSDAIQVYFSDTLVDNIPNYSPLPFLPQISNTIGNIPDTLNWTLVEGYYRAKGGENYIVIGNFNNDLNTTTNLVNPSGSLSQVYLFIDDVALFECGTTHVNDNLAPHEIEVYPTIFNNLINIKMKASHAFQYYIYNMNGNLVKTAKGKGTSTIECQNLSEGFYYYKLIMNGTIFKSGKLIKLN